MPSPLAPKSNFVGQAEILQFVQSSDCAFKVTTKPLALYLA